MPEINKEQEVKIDENEVKIDENVDTRELYDDELEDVVGGAGTTPNLRPRKNHGYGPKGRY